MQEFGASLASSANYGMLVEELSGTGPQRYIVIPHCGYAENSGIWPQPKFARCTQEIILGHFVGDTSKLRLHYRKRSLSCVLVRSGFASN
jgi:hypothetical protein